MTDWVGPYKLPHDGKARVWCPQMGPCVCKDCLKAVEPKTTK